MSAGPAARYGGRRIRWQWFSSGMPRARLSLPRRAGWVSPAEHERYARDVMDVATTQWLGVATGLLGVVLVMATVTAVGRRVPRKLMLLMLGAAFVGLGAGAVILIVDGFTGLFGVGWQWPHGILGIFMLGLMAGTIWSYAGATKAVAD